MKPKEFELALVEAAEEFAGLRYDPNTCPTGNMMAKNIACKVGFRQGARWQRNHVWHKRTEQPKDDSLVLAMRGSAGLIAGPNHDGWEDTVKHIGLETWAYLSDLTPTSFDEIIEANKDVLQRLEKVEIKHE